MVLLVAEDVVELLEAVAGVAELVLELVIELELPAEVCELADLLEDVVLDKLDDTDEFCCVVLAGVLLPSLLPPPPPQAQSDVHKIVVNRADLSPYMLLIIVLPLLLYHCQIAGSEYLFWVDGSSEKQREMRVFMTNARVGKCLYD